MLEVIGETAIRVVLWALRAKEIPPTPQMEALDTEIKALAKARDQVCAGLEGYYEAQLQATIEGWQP